MTSMTTSAESFPIGILGFLFLNHWLWFFLPGVILGIYAQIKLHSIYARYGKVPTRSGMSGADAGRAVLDSAGLKSIPIGEVPGHLTDHYDPMRKALFLSSENYHGQSIAAIGVAAHEAGHALQHQAAYAPLKARMALVPIAGIASAAAMWISIAGMFFSIAKLASIGVVIFGVIFLFQLITLPVEYDASRRAKQQLLRLGLVDKQEHDGVNRVLNAAALTYVAGMVTSLFTFLQFVLMARNNDRD